MTTTDTIQSLCAKHQYLRQLTKKQMEQTGKPWSSFILSVKCQIARLKREYMDMRRNQGMLYEYNGKYYLADKQITYAEYTEYRRLRTLKVA